MLDFLSRILWISNEETSIYDIFDFLKFWLWLFYYCFLSFFLVVRGALRCLALLSGDLDDTLVPRLVPALFPYLNTILSSPHVSFCGLFLKNNHANFLDELASYTSFSHLLFVMNHEIDCQFIFKLHLLFALLHCMISCFLLAAVWKTSAHKNSFNNPLLHFCPGINEWCVQGSLLFLSLLFVYYECFCMCSYKVTQILLVQSETVALIMPMLSSLMEQFSIILQPPVQSEDPDDWSIRMEVTASFDLLRLKSLLKWKLAAMWWSGSV